MANKKVSVEVETLGEDVYHYVQGLPKFQELSSNVKKTVQESTYWEKYGFGLLHIGCAIPLHFVSL